jgi:hypothetical protein
MRADHHNYDDMNKEHGKGHTTGASRLDAALDYATHGIPSFPLHGADERGWCSCRAPLCANPGKHPRTLHGFKDATTDEAQLWRWFGDMWPTANVGVPTGAASRLYVIDVDSKTAEGRQLVAGLRKDAGLLTDGCLVETPGKAPDYDPGLHIWLFSDTATPTSSLGIGELKGDGGYVVAPPSTRAGKEYSFLSRVWMTVDDPLAWTRGLLDAFGVQIPEAAPGPALGDGWAAEWLRTPRKASTRRAPDGLPRIVGYLRGHGIDCETAIAVCELWDARNPEPLGVDEVREHVTAMYRRYGKAHSPIAFSDSSAPRHVREMKVSVG